MEMIGKIERELQHESFLLLSETIDGEPVEKVYFCQRDALFKGTIPRGVGTRVELVGVVDGPKMMEGRQIPVFIFTESQTPDWPREVLITHTEETIRATLGEDYDEENNKGLIADETMTSTQMIEINSWEEIPKGYELVDEEDKEDRRAYYEFHQHGK